MTNFARAELDKEAVFRGFDYEPAPLQSEIHFDDHKNRVVACGIRWGKTFLASHEALAELMVPDTRGWILVPNYALGDYAFRTVFWKFHAKFPKAVRAASERDRYLKTKWNSEVYVKSAENPHALIGESLDYLVVDEAARVGEEAYEQARGRLVDRDGWMLAISTPFGRNWFERAFRRGQNPDERNWKSWHAPTWSNPYLKRDVIDEEMRHKPERIVRQDFYAEFLDDEGLVFKNVDLCGTFEWKREGLTPVPGRAYVAGWDVGRYQDYSVLMVADARARQVVHVDRFQGDWPYQIKRVSDSLARYGRASILMDATGEGDAVFTMLTERNRSAERPFSRRILGERMHNPSVKRDLIESLAAEMESANISYPRHPVLLQELRDYEFEKRPSGAFTFAAPDGQHDDTVVALALTNKMIAKSKSSGMIRFG